MYGAVSLRFLTGFVLNFARPRFVEPGTAFVLKGDQSVLRFYLFYPSDGREAAWVWPGRMARFALVSHYFLM
jgi:hypothetical protein